MSFGNYKYLIYIALVSFIMLALFIFYLWWKKRAVMHLIKNRNLRNTLLVGSTVRQKITAASVIISIILFSFVLLRPQWGDLVREVNNEGTDLLIALDVSKSMDAQDVSPSRLARAKDAIKVMAESLKGDRAALILFAGESFLQCPLTSDIGAFVMFLNSVNTNSIRLQGTDIGSAIRASLRVFAKRRMTSKILVLITDGEDHEGNYSGEIKKLQELGIAVYTVGIGTQSGDAIPAGDDRSGAGYFKDDSGKIVQTRKNTGLLKRIADETGGEYLDITDNLSDVYRIMKIISQQEKNQLGSRIVKEKQEQYQIFAFILMIFLSVSIMLPERRSKP